MRRPGSVSIGPASNVNADAGVVGGRVVGGRVVGGWVVGGRVVGGSAGADSPTDASPDLDEHP